MCAHPNSPAIVAGPMYVDLYMAESFPLVSDHHTILSPQSAKPKARITPWVQWAGTDCRGLGGSSWQFAEHWAMTYGRTVVVCKLPHDLTEESDHRYRDRAFLDDGRWLKEEIEGKKNNVNVGDSCKGLVVETSLADSEFGVDYVFHLRLPPGQQRLWPIFSLAGGAAMKLVWNDVVEVWREHFAETHGTRQAPIVFLGGILRTDLIHTLARALENKRDPCFSDTAEMLARSSLFIDFGRTDLRMLDLVPDKAFRDDVWTCVRHAHTVLVDHTTARQLDLIHADRPDTCRPTPQAVSCGAATWCTSGRVVALSEDDRSRENQSGAGVLRGTRSSVRIACR